MVLVRDRSTPENTHVPHSHTTAHAVLPADYVFSTMQLDFLSLNFEAALLDLVPWAYLSQKSGVTWALVDMIGRCRSNGVAISMLTAHRNEAVAKK